mmetsp:Transcript_37483/g.57391  ORF Transcript_37483/g.57391 Transcript_37483/m.57391 type:complete len:197 (+) Transcript_37483:923-1513(+)
MVQKQGASSQFAKQNYKAKSQVVGIGGQSKKENNRPYYYDILPREAKLIVFYASNLILSRNIEQAIRILSKFGLGFRHESLGGVVGNLNLKKLLAIAYFEQNQEFGKIEYFIDGAIYKFTQVHVPHGKACCNLAKAYFFFSKAVEFTDPSRDEAEVMKVALKACQKAIDSYKDINHPMGQAEALSLLSKIRARLIS